MRTNVIIISQKNKCTDIWSGVIFMGRVILHSDLNNFYASVECLENPSLAGKPVAVAGDPEQRHGIVLAKNDLAKSFGIRTGDALWEARQKCRDIIFVPPHYRRYKRFSAQVRGIYSDYTDMVESFGMDECWLDVTGSRSLFGDGVKIADEIRHRVKKETGITVSVGVSYNKVFAKLGSDMKKPDVTTVIDESSFREKVWPLPMGDMLMVGHAAKRKLAPYGIRTIGDIARCDVTLLENLLGSNGRTLWLYANGMDSSPVAKIWEDPPPKSIGNSFTLPADISSLEDVKAALTALCVTVSARLRAEEMICRTVQLSVRDSGLKWYERQTPLKIPCRASGEMLAAALDMYRRYPPEKSVRSLGVRAVGLERCESEQMSLLPEISRLQRRERLESVCDDIRRKYGKSGVSRAVLITGESHSILGRLADMSNFDSGCSLSRHASDARCH